MAKSQASKRKRKVIRQFRGENMISMCKCGTKLIKSSMHHFLCQKCWNKKQLKKVRMIMQTH